jgi:hypothetical protein
VLRVRTVVDGAWAPRVDAVVRVVVVRRCPCGVAVVVRRPVVLVRVVVVRPVRSVRWVVVVCRPATVR